MDTNTVTEETIPTYPEPADPEPADPEPTYPEPADSEPADHEPTDHEPTDHEPADSEPADPGPPEPDPIAASAPGTPERRPVLRRPFGGRMLTGVAAGLAGYLGIDVTLVRIAFVVLTVIGGAGIPLYLAGFLLIPDEGSDQSIASSLLESLQSRSR